LDELPTKDGKDHLHKATKAGLSIVPLVGGALVELFDTVFSAPIDKRKEEWLIKLAETVDELCTKLEGLTPEKLRNNPEFISACLQASNIAIRTHSEEKLKALKVALKNTVLRKDFDESKKMIFLRLIDQMTPLHIRVFHFLSFPNKYVEELNSRLPSNTSSHWGNLSNVWDEYFDDVKSTNSLLDVITNDLNNYGLITVNKFHLASMTSSPIGLGRDFIEFITDEP
jgi:hypothetical protein